MYINFVCTFAWILIAGRDVAERCAWMHQQGSVHTHRWRHCGGGDVGLREPLLTGNVHVCIVYMHMYAYTHTCIHIHRSVYRSTHKHTHSQAAAAEGSVPGTLAGMARVCAEHVRRPRGSGCHYAGFAGCARGSAGGSHEWGRWG